MNPIPQEATAVKLWYGVNTIIFSNRIIIWTIFIALCAAIFSWWAITLFSIEEENQALYLTTQQTQSHSLRYIVVPQSVEDTSKFIEPQVEIDTSSWKTYRSEKYGFEIKYPEDWNLQEQENIYIFFTSPGTYNVPGGGGDIAPYDVYMIAKENKGHESLPEFVKNLEGGFYEGYKIKKQTMIQNKETLIYDDHGGFGLAPSYIAFINLNSNTILYFLYGQYEIMPLDQTRGTALKMFSTLKFFEPKAQ